MHVVWKWFNANETYQLIGSSW